MASHDFPTTAWSAIAAAADPDHPERRRRLAGLCEAYWRPVFHFFRVSGSRDPEEARDLTQGFFAHLLDGPLLAVADPERGRFRTYLKAALRHFAADARDAARRAKRGGGRVRLSLDLEDDADLAWEDPRATRPEDELDRRWVRELVRRALSGLEDDCRRRGRPDEFEMFRAYYYPRPGDPGDLTYARLAEIHDRSPYDVANALRRARLRFQDLVREHIRETVRDETAARTEFEELFGRR